MRNAWLPAVTSIGLAITVACGDETLVVHEWGTFTALQDEAGRAIGGINTDDEPVPSFVRNVASGLLLPVAEPRLNSKSVARCHSDVTMRLETPIIYFYPQEGLPSGFDVKVEFRGGWLTEYFPDAIANAPGISAGKFGSITPSTVGSLAWKNISLVSLGAGPATDAAVWTTPRRVNATSVRTNGETEKFLFYRGVGHVDAPMRVVRSGPEFLLTTGATVDEVWLADIRADGTAAFRSLRPSPNAPAFLIRTAATFRPEEYSVDAVNGLRSALRESLVNAGLFADEAEAMLDTWNAAYFKNTGMRLFFLVPQRWTDNRLPLKISFPGDCSSCPGKKSSDGIVKKRIQPQITRVMIGRIELVTPEQRALLARIAAGSAVAALDSLQTIARTSNNPLDEPAYRDYLQLGRFRNALVLDELRRNRSAALDAFVERFGLQGYDPLRQ